MDKIVSLDLETTGLDPRIHEVWEVGVVPLDESRPPLHYHFPVGKLAVADPEALKIGRFYDRFTWPGVDQENGQMRATTLVDSLMPGEDHIPAYDAARYIAEALDGATLLGAAVHFDAGFLAPLLRQYGLAPTWHHRFLDLGSFCAGAWGSTKPLATKSIADRIPNADAHNAFADAQWNAAVYRSIVGSQIL